MPAPLTVDQEDIRIALEKAQDIEDNGYPTAAACIRRCIEAAQGNLELRGELKNARAVALEALKRPPVEPEPQS
jgi:hypothetical protein